MRNKESGCLKCNPVALGVEEQGRVERLATALSYGTCGARSRRARRVERLATALICLHFFLTTNYSASSKCYPLFPNYSWNNFLKPNRVAVMKVLRVVVLGIALMSLLSVLFVLVYGSSLNFVSVTMNVALRTGSLASGDVSDNVNHSENRKEVKKHYGSLGYLVILNVPEQLTAATDDFVQLYMVNQRHWNLGMIEPYVLGSALSFVPPTEKEFWSLPLLSKYLNRSVLINTLQTCFSSDDVKLQSFPQFLIDAARDFVIVNFVTHHNPRQPMDMTKHISECDYRDMNKTQSRLNYHLHKVRHEAMSRHGTKYKFVGVHSLCVKAVPKTPFSMLQVVEYIKQWRKNTGDSVLHFPHFTIVIPEWRKVHSIADSIFYYYDPSYTSSNLTAPCHLEAVPSSSYITRTTNNVLKKLSLPRPIIAVHVRTERVAISELERKIIGFIDLCLKQFSSVLETVIRIHNVSREHVILIHDGGKYGSKSMSQSLQKASKYIVSNIKSLGIRNVQYTPEKIGNDATVDRTLAQFVDRELLVSADVLITVGFGGYQKSVIEQFKNRKKKKLGRKGELYRVCTGRPMTDILPSPS